MKTLHSITPVLQVFFTGLNIPCQHDYHVGYEEERTDRFDHNQCIQMMLGFDQPLYELCQCEHCLSTYRESHWVIEERPTTTRMCSACQREMHPIPDPSRFISGELPPTQPEPEPEPQPEDHGLDDDCLNGLHEADEREEFCIHCGVVI